MTIKPLEELTGEENLRLIDLLMAFSDEYAAPVQAREEDVAKLIQECDGFAAILDDEVIGAIGGLWHHNPWNCELLMLTELFWNVRKAYRGTTAAHRLMNKFLELGKDASVSLSTLDSTTASAARYLSRRGFHKKECTWIRWKNAGV